MRPHDILGKRIGEYLPKESDGGAEFLKLMRDSYDILKDHPVNIARKARGLKPANSAWLWSPGKKPQLPSFKQIRNVEIRRNEFEKTSSQKIKRFML